VRTFSSVTGFVKLGQPVPESNFASESKRGAPQQAHLYGAGLLAVVVLTGESALRPFLSRNAILLRRELFTPLLVALPGLIAHLVLSDCPTVVISP